MDAIWAMKNVYESGWVRAARHLVFPFLAGIGIIIDHGSALRFFVKDDVHLATVVQVDV